MREKEERVMIPSFEYRKRWYSYTRLIKEERLATTLGCEKSGRNHQGESKHDTDICFKCGEEGHFAEIVAVSAETIEDKPRSHEENDCVTQAETRD